MKQLYNDLDELPIWNWEKFKETKETKYLTRDLIEVKDIDKHIEKLIDEEMLGGILAFGGLTTMWISGY